MRIAYLECFSGISGDMFLGALVDAGVPPELLIRTVAALGVDARLEFSRVDRSGISSALSNQQSAPRHPLRGRTPTNTIMAIAILTVMITNIPIPTSTATIMPTPTNIIIAG